MICRARKYVSKNKKTSCKQDKRAFVKNYAKSATYSRFVNYSGIVANFEPFCLPIFIPMLLQINFEMFPKYCVFVFVVIRSVTTKFVPCWTGRSRIIIFIRTAPSAIHPCTPACIIICRPLPPLHIIHNTTTTRFRTRTSTQCRQCMLIVKFLAIMRFLNYGSVTSKACLSLPLFLKVFYLHYESYLFGTNLPHMDHSSFIYFHDILILENEIFSIFSFRKVVYFHIFFTLTL